MYCIWHTRPKYLVSWIPPSGEFNENMRFLVFKQWWVKTVVFWLMMLWQVVASCLYLHSRSTILYYHHDWGNRYLHSKLSRLYNRVQKATVQIFCMYLVFRWPHSCNCNEGKCIYEMTKSVLNKIHLKYSNSHKSVQI